MLSIARRVAHHASRKPLPVPRGTLCTSQRLNFASTVSLETQQRHYAVSATEPRREVASNLHQTITSVERSLESIQDYADVDQISQGIQQTQAILEDPQLWITNPAGAAQVQSRLAEMQHQLSTRNRLRSSFERLKELSALAEKAGDSDLQTAVLLDLQGLLNSAQEHLFSLWLSDPIDQNSAYIDIRPASRGTDASDWVSTLARMYTNWARSRNYAVKIVDETPGDVAGVKATTLLVDGRYAYGHAQYESGIHCLTREPLLGEAGEYRTSSAAVRVSPCIDNDGPNATVDLKPTDLQISATHSQEAGVHNARKSASGVRVVHIPTGIAVSCQRESNEHQNRTLALSLLKAKLYDVELHKKAQSAADAPHVLPANSWGSVIRTYTVHPQPLIKDLRTGYEVASDAVQGVLDGNLGGFMEASLRQFKKKKA